MLTREQLREIHKNDLPLHILEQDYIQGLFLQELYTENENLVFKGGTYLKHAYGLDRFSEDLDFTYKENTQPNNKKPTKLPNLLRETAKTLENYGIEANIDKTTKTKNTLTSRLRYKGPLYNGSKKSKGSIEIEISLRNDIFLEPNWKRLFFNYPETRVVNVLGLTKKELLAEKLRALSTRSKPRDLYDVWFLLNQNTETDKNLFEKKMKIIGKEPQIRININPKDYKRDLTTLLEKPPKLKDITEKTKEHLGPLIQKE